MQTLGNMDLNVYLQFWIENLPQEMVLLRSVIVGFGKQNVFVGVCFIDFIKSNLEQDILKRVIMNGMTGCNWRFKMFDRICLAANSDEIVSVSK